jgi:shikimate kinase
MKLFLAGVACVGKTTLGKLVAERLGHPFFDLDAEVERFYDTSIERLQNRCRDRDEFRKKSALVLTDLTTRRGIDDFVIALPARGLMLPYLRVVRRAGARTVVLTDRAENILSRVVFYDLDSKPIAKLLTQTEKRLYLKEIRAELAYFRPSYRKADLTIDLSSTCGIEEAAAKVVSAVLATRGEPPAGASET